MAQETVLLFGLHAFGDDEDDDRENDHDDAHTIVTRDSTPQLLRSMLHFIRHLPQLTPRELREMKSMNPITPMEMKEQQEEEKFLAGGDASHAR